MPKIPQSFAKSYRSATTGLSGQLLLLTIIFVMLAEVFIFLPTIANMRLAWLRDRLHTAVSIAQVMEGLQTDLPREIQEATLLSIGADLIALRDDNSSRLLAVSAKPSMVDAHYDLRDVRGIQAIIDAVSIIVTPSPQTIRVIGDASPLGGQIEVVMNSKPLRDAMLCYLANVALMSIALAIIIGSLIFVSFNHIFVQPIRRLSEGMLRFSECPHDPTRVFASSKGMDELSVAGQQLSQMQENLHFALKQKNNLADLGLAVSKINHDMRNILAAAQLLSDRLMDVQDPIVRSFAPRLIRALGRAVNYTEELLAFGQAKETLPKRQDVLLLPMVTEIRDMVLLGTSRPIQFDVEFDPALTVYADPDQLFRVIYNLSRNAVQALEYDRHETPAGRHLAIHAARLRNVVSIMVDDNGPGMPPKARENLFSPFKGSVRSGGTGLGLVIVRELVLAHGGIIALVEKPGRGTQFRIEIPNHG